MHRALTALAAGLALALAAGVSAPEPSLAQQSSAKNAAATPARDVSNSLPNA